MQNHSFIKYSAILTLLLSSLLITACSKTDKSGAANSTGTDASIKVDIPVVKIGFAAPLTGPQAHLGKDMENAAQMAIDDVNTTGAMIATLRVKFELLVEDDMADPRTATTVAQKFVDKGVSGIIGHLNSGTTIPASKIYNSNGIVQISPSATAIAYTAQGYKNAFRVMANDGQQGKGLGDYAVQNLGAKKIAIIDDRTAYGQGLADEFEKAAVAAGAVIVVREFTNDKAADFNAILTNIKGKSPELLFFGGMDKQGALMVRQMHELGLKIPFMGGDGVRSEEFIKNAGADAEGVVGSLPGVSFEQMPEGNAFKQKFEAKYGAIQVYAPYTYDAVKMMVAAMQQAGSSDPQKYLPILAAMQHSGVTANIAFDAKGDLQSGAVTLYKVVNGQWQTLQTVGAAEVKATEPVDPFYQPSAN
jgi:branched-chain amino acid transport system substrate-binding protein